jgi:hypothetical protein
MQQALNRSYADRDKIVSDIEKLREDLERSQASDVAAAFSASADGFSLSPRPGLPPKCST